LSEVQLGDGGSSTRATQLFPVMHMRTCDHAHLMARFTWLDSRHDGMHALLSLPQVPGVLPAFPPASAVPDMANIAASLGLAVPGIGAAGMAAAGMAALGSLGIPVTGGGGGGGGGGAGGEQQMG
jgi:hypothetical protein